MSAEYLYITTPIFYPNAEPHLGHAYTVVIADILTRLGRLLGDSVWMSTGVDEHGQKVAKAAADSARSPQQHVDLLSTTFQSLSTMLNAQPDVFVRTTDPAHHRVALEFWHQISPYLYEGEYSGWYSPRDEAFCIDKTDDAVWTSERCIFFKLSAFTERLLAMYQANPQMIKPESARNEILAMLQSGLRDLCVTRHHDWGIPVPRAGFEGYTMYVWIDALTNYITASPKQKYQPEMLHIIGKDILKFHAIYWPAMLMAAGYNPPNEVLAHGWWICGKRKMSKSAGNAVHPKQFVEQYGADGIRYFFARAKRIENDMEVSWQDVDKVCRQELLAGAGNLGQRLCCMIYKYAGDLPKVECSLPAVLMLASRVAAAYHDRDTYQYAAAMWDAVSALNKYISDSEPWKADPNAKGQILGCALEGWREIVHWIAPLTPHAAAQWAQQIQDVRNTPPTPVIAFGEGQGV